MADNTKSPVVLELASLPREQIGPFLLLGLDKDGSAAAIEAHWAQRVIWARKKQIHAQLEDVNWAREVLTDPDRRAKADSASLNLDTAEGTLRQLCERFGAGGYGAPLWTPREVEKASGPSSASVDLPDAAAIRQSLAAPVPPDELPAVHALLEQLFQEPLDPWTVDVT